MNIEDVARTKAEQWLDSCRKFVITCEQQLAQAKRQVEKAEDRLKELDDARDPEAVRHG